LSVVPGDWRDLKKYNMHELYNEAAKESKNAAQEPTEGGTS
jgi:hypothetical protein